MIIIPPSARQALLALALMPATLLSAQPNPDSGSLSNSGDSVSFEGSVPAGVNPTPGVHPVCVTGAADCDIYALNVSHAPGDSDITITIGWGDDLNDFDIYLVDADGNEVSSAASSSNPETMIVKNLPDGDYQIQILPYLVAEDSYQGQASHNGTSTPEGEEFANLPAGLNTRVVVAVIDSAINPYHEFYHAGSSIYPNGAPSAVTPAVLAELGVKEENHILLTRTGNMEVDQTLDQEIWDNIQRGELYWFKGTNIIAVSYAGGGQPPLRPVSSKSAHGVGTSASVLTANPDAVILFVETEGDLANDQSHDLAFIHPAVDIISTSYGAGVPNTGFPLPENRAFRNTYQSVVELGKMHFSSGGNGPGLTPLRAGAGPWWSVGVSGIEEGDSNGRTTVSGNFPDFLSDFTQTLPYCHTSSDCYNGVGGTSFSTPLAAGIASRVLLQSRRALGHIGGIVTGDNGERIMASNGAGTDISNWMLRRALETAAHVPDSTEDYDPVAGVLDLGAVPFNPLAPWLQMGWGNLSPLSEKAVVNSALGHLGLRYATRSKPQGFCEFQTEVILDRKRYWDRLAPQLPAVLGSEQTGNTPAADPFIFCASTAPGHPASNDTGGTAASGNDGDGDGVPDSFDNCPDASNASQADRDGNGVGDACDVAPEPLDYDGDGVLDADDNCAGRANADQADLNANGIGDACEVSLTPVDPLAACSAPGVTVLTDEAGDIFNLNDAQPANPAVPFYDLRSLSVVQPFDTDGGDYTLKFLLKVESLLVVPTGDWPVNFCSPKFACENPDSNTKAYGPDNKYYTVRMSTLPTNGGSPSAPVYQILQPTAAGSTTGSRTIISARAESGFNPDGTISLVVNAADIGLDAANAGVEFLNRFQVRVTPAATTPDNMPNGLSGEGTYSTVPLDRCDPDGGSNTAPVASAGSAVVDQDGSVTISLSATDADGDNLSYAIAGNPSNGSLGAVSGDQVTYTPNAGYFGSDSFTFKANDGTEDSNVATVSITVNEATNDDADGDGVVDSADNCPNDANADQANFDGDTQGDACDTDDDNDGILDTEENAGCQFDADTSCGEGGNGNNGTLDAELSITTDSSDAYTVSFDASASHYEENADAINGAMFQFVFGDGTGTPAQASPTVSHTYEAAGDYTAYVVVTDANGNAAKSEDVTVSIVATVTVTDGGANAARLKLSNASGPAPLTVSFDATSSTTAEGYTITGYSWDFDGDGTVDLIGSNGKVTHVYTRAGSYTPSVTVSFGNGSETASSVAKAAVNAGTGGGGTAPVAAAAGGGSLGWLLLMPLLGAGLARRRITLH